MRGLSNRSARRALADTAKETLEHRQALVVVVHEQQRLTQRVVALEAALSGFLAMPWSRRLVWAVTGRARVPAPPAVVPAEAQQPRARGLLEE